MNLSLPPTIIGIAGTNGSGKDTVGKILAEQHNYLFVSVTDALREELKNRGLPPAREHMRELSAEWRRKFGLGVLIDKAKALYDHAEGYSGLAMSSLRNPGEADVVHGYGGLVIWVDADSRIRYERIRLNAQSRGIDRQIDDDKSYADFMADEASEMERPQGGDNATLSMAGVKAKSDLFITNNSNSLIFLSRDLDKLLKFKP